jgi:hypothetical protein
MRLGAEHIYPSVRAAVAAYQAQFGAAGSEMIFPAPAGQ